jgi:hypothetical protein
MLIESEKLKKFLECQTPVYWADINKYIKIGCASISSILDAIRRDEFAPDEAERRLAEAREELKPEAP